MKLFISKVFCLFITFSFVFSPVSFAESKLGLGAEKPSESEDVIENALCHSFLNFQAPKLRSNMVVNFCDEFKGKALLVVNTASKCGFTSQFKGLERLHQQYGNRLAVIGFPSDDFRQEYQSTEKVAEVCFINYGVTFTMLEPSSVKGSNANDFFKSLISKSGKEPTWNFNKYVISSDGRVVRHFGSSVKPNDKRLISAIETVL